MASGVGVGVSRVLWWEFMNSVALATSGSSFVQEGCIRLGVSGLATWPVS